ncbi:hypothetical protein N7479_006216 [Penicillium vulpinum]|nr:hypothetical protein N7479_006216 [Penicillium vulpinum]
MLVYTAQILLNV